jgi:positive regulator of sigma E activity
MQKETVEVVEVVGAKVKIKFTKSQMCSCCRMHYLCGQGQEILTINNCGFSLNKGDKIEVAIDERKTLLANIITFLIPAIVFIAGLVVFQKKGEVASFFLALGAVCVYYIIVKLFLKKYGKKFDIAIVRKITDRVP